MIHTVGVRPIQTEFKYDGARTIEMFDIDLEVTIAVYWTVFDDVWNNWQLWNMQEINLIWEVIIPGPVFYLISSVK